MFKYMVKFTEFAHFANAYVATYMAKVRKFEDGLKLSIRGKIMGFLLQDMDSMTIERERLMKHEASMMRVLVRIREKISLLLAWGRSRGLFLQDDFKDKAEVIRAKAKSGHLARRGR